MKYVRESAMICEGFFLQVFEYVVEQYEGEYVKFEVYDEDPGKDDFIGR